jgi:hypothetical protein
MSQSRQKLESAIKAQPTEMLLACVRQMNCRTEMESIVACGAITNELELRMDQASFMALMAELEADLMAA